jgi:anti-sigma B factor antagonist
MMFNLNGKVADKNRLGMKMTLRPRTVTVEQLPESLSVDQAATFLANLQVCLIVDHPYLVLDCSKVRQMNKSVIDLILSCLEEAMKRNGDVRLAGVSPPARAALASVGADRLFPIFASNADAVSSFHQHPASAGVHKHAQENAGEFSNIAA